MKKLTADGYSAGIAIVLAYSALEMAHRANGHDIATIPIVDGKLAKRLRETLNPVGLSEFPLIDSLADRLKDRIRKLMSGESDDILPVCRAYRHLIAHGHFTPWGAEMHTRARQKCLADIRDRLLVEGDVLLDQHYQELAKVG